MPNSRISDLNETHILRCQSSMEPFIHQAEISESGNRDDKASFLIARSGSHNEKIHYGKLKRSLLDNVVFLTGDQLVSGEKTFADPCSFLSKTNVNEVLDSTQTGDISGNIFVGTSGLFQNVGVGNVFHQRSSDIKYTMHIVGNSLFFGDATQTGNSRHEGDLLRMGNTSLSGGYFITGDSFFTGDKFLIGDEFRTGDLWQIGDGFREGDSDISGDIVQTGDIFSQGYYWRSGNLSTDGDTSVTGDLFHYGDLIRVGNIFHEGDLTQTGDSLIDGDKTVTEDIFLGEYLYHHQDTDTFLKLSEDEIKLQAGTQTSISLKEDLKDIIQFSTKGEEQFRITNDGKIAINNIDPISELSVTGKSYLEDSYEYEVLNKKFHRIFGGDDETVSFKTKIRKGFDSYDIQLPKTFKVKPVVSVKLENKSGGIILPFMLENITRTDFKIKFGTFISDNEYVVHVTALTPSILDGVNSVHYEQSPHVTCGDHGSNRQGIQRFYTEIQSETNSLEIFFPFGFSEPPVVCPILEGPNNIIPYAISGVNNNSYTITFGANVNQDYTVHTFSSSSGTKQLG